jgi:hypothetical protein
METPEGRADRLIAQFAAEALGPVEAHHRRTLESKIWRVVNEQKEEIAREAGQEHAAQGATRG